MFFLKKIVKKKRFRESLFCGKFLKKKKKKKKTKNFFFFGGGGGGVESGS